MAGVEPLVWRSTWSDMGGLDRARFQRGSQLMRPAPDAAVCEREDWLVNHDCKTVHKLYEAKTFGLR